MSDKLSIPCDRVYFLGDGLVCLKPVDMEKYDLIFGRVSYENSKKTKAKKERAANGRNRRNKSKNGL